MWRRWLLFVLMIVLFAPDSPAVIVPCIDDETCKVITTPIFHPIQTAAAWRSPGGRAGILRAAPREAGAVPKCRHGTSRRGAFHRGVSNHRDGPRNPRAGIPVPALPDLPEQEGRTAHRSRIQLAHEL